MALPLRQLDEWEEIEARRRLGRRLLQALSRAILQIWQRRRIASLREQAERRRGSPLALTELADRLGWERTRAYEAERDHGDCVGEHDLGGWRLWPRLRSLDEITALELASIELADGESSSVPPLSWMLEAVVEHLSQVSPGLVRIELERALGARIPDELLLAFAAWICDQRKAREVREASPTKLQSLLPDALRAFFEIAARHYDELVEEHRLKDS